MDWPELPFDAWRDTCTTLQRCLQVVGKVQLALTPPVNHFWNVAFRVTARGLETPPLPYAGGTFTAEMDFVHHNLVVRTRAGEARALAFLRRPVADFYRDMMALLESLGIEVAIWDHPVELPDEPIPFHSDRQHSAYDAAAVSRWWRIVSESAQVFEQFRSGFLGKCSPVHFFWGSFDLAVSRYSGRRAPPHPGASALEQEAYSHEVSSVGFWPGDPRHPAPAYFAYTAPKPPRLEDAAVRPAAAYWNGELGEFVLPYGAVRSARSPRAQLLEFCQSTYAAGATLGGWNRPELERGTSPGVTSLVELDTEV